MKLRARNIRNFRRLIKDWGKENMRDFPWRHTDDPYEVAVAELMLRRTQAVQVAPVYREFLRSYPDTHSLACADPDEVRDTLHSLGLHWRAQNIIDFGCAVVEKFEGQVPVSDRKLRDLPGVGPYVSAAVRCFALGEPVPLVDTNTIRVVGRVFGINTEGRARNRKEVRQSIARCVDPDEPRLYNFSLLDFASLVCRARDPLHDRCEFSKWRRCDHHSRGVESGQ